MTHWYKKPSDLQGQVLSPFGPLIYQGRMSQETVDKTNQCIDKVKDDLSLDLVSQLAGRVELQRSLQENIDNSCMDEILDHIENYSVQMGMPFSQEEFQIQGLWANVQQRYEYNPIHSHDGMFSFVYYTKNTITQEEATTNKWDTVHDDTEGMNKPIGGSIELHYGEPQWCSQPSFLHFPQEGDLLVFPAWLRHSVYPFYCEGERVSIAGNIHQRER